MPPRTRSKKSLELPKIVLEAKAFLKQKDSIRFAVMEKLTESEDAELQQALIRMWVSLEKSINKHLKGNKEQEALLQKALISMRMPPDIFINTPQRIGGPGDMWPHYFVEHVRSCANYPPYFYQTKNERKELVEDIKKQITGLTKALKANNLDHHVAYAESKNTLDFVERMGFLDNWKAEQSKVEKPTVSEILDRLLKTIEAEVTSIRQTRKDGFEEARLFVRKLAKYLKDVQGDASNAVLATAAKAIMDRDYTEADIIHILQR